MLILRPLLVLALSAGLSLVPVQSAEPTGWAVLIEKEDYADSNGRLSDLKVGYLDQIRMHALLRYYGWPEDHILEIREPGNQADVKRGLAWLAERVKKEDLAFFYYNGHGTYLRDFVKWKEVFPAAWAGLACSRKLAMVDACHAGEFVAPLAKVADGVAIGGVAADELGWKGVWKEGLPLVGVVFSHCWVDTMTDPTADTDHDGRVSVQEGARRAEARQRVYMHEVVWADQRYAFPKAQKVADYPHVPVIDTLGAPLFLDLRR